MTTSHRKTKRTFGAMTSAVDLSAQFNWPRRVPQEPWWQNLAAQVREYPSGEQRSWGIPFQMAGTIGPRTIIVSKNKRGVTIPLDARATFLCILHTWNQIPSTVRMEDPTEGLVVAEYELIYDDGTRHIQTIRGRFEVAMVESPGPPWLAMPFNMWETIDPVDPPPDIRGGRAQLGFQSANGIPLLYAMPNPHPERTIASLVLRGLQESPLLVAGLTLYEGSGHPLAHLPRRTYRVNTSGNPRSVKNAEVDLGGCGAHRTHLRSSG